MESLTCVEQLIKNIKKIKGKDFKNFMISPNYYNLYISFLDKCRLY